jgi:sortase A
VIEQDIEQNSVSQLVVDPVRSASATAVADPVTSVPPAPPNVRVGEDNGPDAAPGSEGNGKGPSGAKRPTSGVSRTEVVGLSVTVAALLLVMFLLYLYLFSGLTGARNQALLLHRLTSDSAAVYNLATGHKAQNAEPVAVLEIPSLQLHEAIVEGTTASDLQLGPGLVSGTNIPGEPGNAIIAGRRVSFGGPFSGIGGLQPGDQIMVTDFAGNFRFSVVSVGTITTSSFTPPGVSRSWLTLVTSNSSLLPSGKVVVIAKLIGRPSVIGKAAPAPAPTSYTLPNLAGSPASGFLAFIWALALLGVLALMVLSIRKWRQPWISWLLAAPILLGCGLFACESLARCLPSTL